MEKDRLLIATSDCCTYYQIDTAFIHSLQEAGLIEIALVEEQEFLDDEQLQRLEKFIRWHYDLEINVEGIEAISHLLSRATLLEKEINALRNRLRLYESEQRRSI